MSKRKPQEPITPLPHWVYPTSSIQSRLGAAYLRAVICCSGCKLLREDEETDVGVDFHLRFVRSVNGEVKDDAVLDLQLKTSYAVTESDTHIKYNMDLAAYDKLRSREIIPRILVLYWLPRDVSQWLSVDETMLVMKKSAYWLDMTGFPPRKGSQPLVQIPKSQQFCVAAMLGPIRDLAEKWPARRTRRRK